jgi:putative ABC transport system permease protein
MWWRILKGLLYRSKGGFFLILISAVLGSALVASLASVALGISGKISRELKKYGANILVKGGEGNYLNEEDIYKLKTQIFWRYNIVGISPFLFSLATVSDEERKAQVVVAGTWFDKRFPTQEKFSTGVGKVNPYLKVKGSFPRDGDYPEAVVGKEVAEKVGASLGERISLKVGGKKIFVKVVGIMESGGYEDSQIYVPLDFWQKFLSLKGKVSQILVSAVTVPLDDFGRRDPKTMSRREYDKWYCTAYVTSVSKQIEEAVKGSQAKPIWRIVEAEGKVLQQLSFLIFLLVFLSLISASLAVSTTLMSNVLRRRKEIGLLKALGGEPIKVVQIFLIEALFIGVLAGIFGFLVGYFLANFLGKNIFGSPFEFSFYLLFLSLSSSLLITILGSYFPLKQALKVPAGEVMRV